MTRKTKHLGKIDVFEIQDEPKKPSILCRIGEFVMGCLSFGYLILLIGEQFGLVTVTY